LDYRRRTGSDDQRRVKALKFRFFTVSLNGANILSTPIHSPTSWIREKQKHHRIKTTLAEVIKEMAKPRVAMSARETLPHCSKGKVLVVENNVEK
jgi:hypothetical protein